MHQKHGAWKIVSSVALQNIIRKEWICLMKDITKTIIEKISSYNLFNNLLPGIVFCYVVERTTQIVIKGDSFFENLFIYYFIGVLVGRISSLFIEPMLMKMKVKDKQSNVKEAYIKFVPYKDYVEASESNPFIKVLNESCNMYRCFISIFLLAACCKIYDSYISVWLCNVWSAGNDIKVIVMCLVIALLFAMCYKKQVDYIRNRVEKYTNTKK